MISSSSPELNSSTRNLLDNFMNQKRTENALFKQLKSRSSSTSTSNTKTSNSSSVSSASSLFNERRNKNKGSDPASRNVLDLLPRGRSGRYSGGDQEEDEEDEASLMAQAEALADLERLNGVELSTPISAVRMEKRYGNLNSDEDKDEDEVDDADAPDATQPYHIDVDEFRRYFGEQWHLSQFWYSSDFSYHLARCLYALLEIERSDSPVPGLENEIAGAAPKKSERRTTIKRIGFVCSPTAYVAFRYLYPETSPQLEKGKNGIEVEAYLFDCDERFSLLTPPHRCLPDPVTLERFVHYDLNKPLVLPRALEKQLDMVIIDPPYLNAETNMNIGQTVKKLLKSEEEGKILLITGRSIAVQACEIYGNEKTGPLRRAEKLAVEHNGLKNEFNAWGNWDGVERFGDLERLSTDQTL